MNETNQVEFNIEVSAQDASTEDIDWMTRQLLSELREWDIESAELTKGGWASAFVELVQTWTSRGQGRTVKFKGRGIEFEGSPEELHRLLAKFEKENNKK